MPNFVLIQNQLSLGVGQSILALVDLGFLLKVSQEQIIVTTLGCYLLSRRFQHVVDLALAGLVNYFNGLFALAILIKDRPL